MIGSKSPLTPLPNKCARYLFVCVNKLAVCVAGRDRCLERRITKNSMQLFDFCKSFAMFTRETSISSLSKNYWRIQMLRNEWGNTVKKLIFILIFLHSTTLGLVFVLLWVLATSSGIYPKLDWMISLRNAKVPSRFPVTMSPFYSGDKCTPIFLNAS